MVCPNCLAEDDLFTSHGFTRCISCGYTWQEIVDGKKRPTLTPPPAVGNREVYPVVMALLLERVDKGKRTYGHTLHTHNGRKALKDLQEELIDAVMYVTQLLMEDEIDSSTLV